MHVELFSISIRGFYAFLLKISCKRKNVERHIKKRWLNWEESSFSGFSGMNRSRDTKQSIIAPARMQIPSRASTRYCELLLDHFFRISYVWKFESSFGNLKLWIKYRMKISNVNLKIRICKGTIRMHAVCILVATPSMVIPSTK